MPIVHINTIAAQDKSQLVYKTLSSCFNSEHVQDFKAVI